MTDITPEQRANLAKLAAYLRTLPPEYPDFAMDQFVAGIGGSGGSLVSTPECGTAACAAGHGPLAGVPFVEGETWGRYSRRAFINASPFAANDAWDWCFAATWSNVDNTAHGAAARIEWMLKNGVPDNADEQRWGEEPLCYTPGAPQ